MSQLVLRKSNKQTTLSNSLLIGFAFSTAYFPRILDAAGAPAPVNFVHFVVVPLVVLIVLTTTRTRTKQQARITDQLLTGLFILFGVIIISAIVNEAGYINVIVEYMLLAEPFMLLLAIVAIPMSLAQIKRFQRFIFACATINLLLAFVQKPLIDAGLLFAQGFNGTDGAQGVFFVSGAGNYVSSTVSLKFGLYFFLLQKKSPIWLRGIWLAAAVMQLIISDSKQIMIAGGIAFGILIVRSLLKSNRKALVYLIVAAAVGSGFIWALNNVEYFAAFENGIKKLSEWGAEGEARKIKLAPLKIAVSHYTSGLNWLFGLGPGHSFGRLGGWFLRDYAGLLQPLGATIHPASTDAMYAYWNSWIAQESTFYHPFYGWAGIWGDLGLVGLAAYVYLGYLAWTKLALSDLSRLYILIVVVVGLIFTQMEEPGYMLFTAALIGLNWQSYRLKNNR
ncbi:MAG: hypothetical protein AAFY63_00480 [Cyanobacteria bacterium J06643_13]